MTPQEFNDKWSRSQLGERQGAQQHFLDLCTILDEKSPSQTEQDGTANRGRVLQRKTEHDTGPPLVPDQRDGAEMQ